MQNPSVLFTLYAPNLYTPYPCDPWVVDQAQSLQCGIYWMTKNELEVINQSVVANTEDPIHHIIGALKTLDTWAAQQQGPISIFSVHSKSVLCRVMGYWSRIRGVDYPALQSAIHHDIVELVNHPTVLRVEERFAFSPIRCGRTCGTSVDIYRDCPTAPALILWKALQTFLP